MSHATVGSRQVDRRADEEGLVRKDGLIDGFFGMVADVDAARDAMDRAGAALRTWSA